MTSGHEDPDRLTSVNAEVPDSLRLAILAARRDLPSAGQIDALASSVAAGGAFLSARPASARPTNAPRVSMRTPKARAAARWGRAAFTGTPALVLKILGAAAMSGAMATGMMHALGRPTVPDEIGERGANASGASRHTPSLARAIDTGIAAVGASGSTAFSEPPLSVASSSTAARPEHRDLIASRRFDEATEGPVAAGTAPGVAAGIPPSAPGRPASSDARSAASSTSAKRSPDVPAASPDSPARDAVAEATLLLRARSLVRSDPAAALELTRRHEREFPSGQLTQEREAIAIAALQNLGRTQEAQQRAAAFERRFPDSVHRRTVDR